jgi:hypothetical protein
LVRVSISPAQFQPTVIQKARIVTTALQRRRDGELPAGGGRKRAMARLRFYQLSLRRLFLLTGLTGGGLWLALWWVGTFTPPQGETLVTPGEQRVLQTMLAEHGLTYAPASPYT